MAFVNCNMLLWLFDVLKKSHLFSIHVKVWTWSMCAPDIMPLSWLQCVDCRPEFLLPMWHSTETSEKFRNKWYVQWLELLFIPQTSRTATRFSLMMLYRTRMHIYSFRPDRSKGKTENLSLDCVTSRFIWNDFINHRTVNAVWSTSFAILVFWHLC